jgi:hypothetical protein
MKTTLLIATAALIFTGCGLDENSYKKSEHGSSTLAITNSEGESDILRTGTSLNIATGIDLNLTPDMVYNVTVKNLNTGSEVGKADLMADEKGSIELTTVAHDLGEFDDVGERHTLQVKVSHPGSGVLVEKDIPVVPHVLDFTGHGVEVDQVQPPHLFSATSAGKPNNSFVVGGAPVGDEIGAPIYAAGKGFPKNVSKVDVYVVKDGDKWQGKQIPQPGSSDYVGGPYVASVKDGVMQTTKIDWIPKGEDVGVYDLIVDVDRNGSFDYNFSQKDGADGEDKVGFTLQYGKTWFKTKMTMKSKHLIVNLAFSSNSRSAGSWKNSYSSGQKIYSYVNPPVQRGGKHGYVQKVLVEHKDWETFWNNPDKMIQGGSGYGKIPIANSVVPGTGGTPQQGCTNSPPVALANPGAIPAPQGNGNDGTKQAQNVRRFDVVFDYGKDGFYDIGVDFLDVISVDTTGKLLTSEDLKNLKPDQIYGLEIKFNK